MVSLLMLLVEYPTRKLDTHNATGKAHGLEHMSIKVDNKGCEDCVQEHRQQYLDVDCPLDEAKDQWPSGLCQTEHVLGERRE